MLCALLKTRASLSSRCLDPDVRSSFTSVLASFQRLIFPCQRIAAVQLLWDPSREEGRNVTWTMKAQEATVAFDCLHSWRKVEA